MMTGMQRVYDCCMTRAARHERPDNLDRRKSDIDVFDHVIGGVHTFSTRAISPSKNESNDDRGYSDDIRFHAEQ